MKIKKIAKIIGCVWIPQQDNTATVEFVPYSNYGYVVETWNWLYWKWQIKFRRKQ